MFKKKKLWLDHEIYFKSLEIFEFYNQACNKCVDIAEIIEYFPALVYSFLKW